MKILKVYDKVNRNIVYSDSYVGNITIKEFVDDTTYFSIIINTKIFNSKNERMSYLSCENVINGKKTETLEITKKYVIYHIYDENFNMIYSERTHTKDDKSFLLVDRIYDTEGEFIELENYKGSKQVKFKIKKNIIEQLLDVNS